MEELRREFVDAAKTTKNFSSLCREFGISRKTGYKWVERNKRSCAMSDRSHAPLHIPGKTPVE
ncbi:MAG: transposase, partial [Clostridia bacterium]|nr:transposase [Clostridia bacterium]